MTSFIAFVDYGTLQDVFAEREVEGGLRVVGEVEGFHGGKGVDCGCYFGVGVRDVAVGTAAGWWSLCGASGDGHVGDGGHCSGGAAMLDGD